MQKVYLDVQPILKNRSGIGWYTYNTITELLKINQKNFEIWATCFDFLGKNNSKSVLSNLDFDGIMVQKLIPKRLFKQLWYYSNIKNEFFFNGGDIYHFCNFITPPLKADKKIIVHIYDMVFKKFPDTMEISNLNILNRHLEYSINKANHIITISQSSKKDLLDYYSTEENKITVLPPGVDLEFFKKGHIVSQEIKEYLKRKYNLPNKYFLFLGTIEPRKNIQTVFKAYSELPKELKKEYKLVIGGNIGWKSEETRNLPKKLGIENDIVFTGYIDEPDKPYIYSLAKVFIFPSIYEGFGMPVTESLASGTPVITSNTSSMPEAGGDGASYVNPLDYYMISKELINYVNDNNYLELKLEKGKQHIKNFSWKRNALRIMEIYNAL